MLKKFNHVAIAVNDLEQAANIYKDALRQILESERIKNKIRDYEQDMWNN